jgi:hypothetical protein
MPRKPIGETAMTGAERQPSFACSVARYRAARGRRSGHPRASPGRGR